MSYGFRLWRVTLREAFRREPPALEWTLPEGHFAQRAGRIVDLLVQSNHRVKGDPGWRDGQALTEIPDYATPARNSKIVRWFDRSAEGNHDLHLSMEIAYGRYASFELGITADSVTELGDTTPSNRMRAELFLPEQGADDGLLVVESIGRVCPVESYIRWLAVGDHIMQNRSGSGLQPLRLEPVAVVDRAHLLEMVREASKLRVILTGSPEYSSGISTKAHDVRLEVGVLSEAKESFIDRIVGMAGSVPVTPADVLALLEVPTGFSGLEFQDGAFEIKSGDESKTLPFAKLAEIFTYPTTKDIAPDGQRWLSDVRGKMDELGLHYDW